MEAQSDLVVADFEAGLGTLSRMKAGQLDVLLVVVEPTAKAIEVASRALAMIREGSVGRAVVLANRVQGDEDAALVARAFPGTEVIVVPDDPAIRAADAQGGAVFDLARDSPAVRAVRALAARLLSDRS